MTGTTVFSQLLSSSQRAYKTLKSPLGQRVAWALAVIIFFGGFVISLATQPGLFESFQPGPVVVILCILCPVLTLFNMAAVKKTAQLAGVEMSAPKALKLAVVSTAVNHLPLPGGPIIRTAAITEAGGRLKDAGLANVACGFAWISMTFLFTGLWALFLDGLLAGAALGLGVMFFIATIAIARSLPGKRDTIIRLCVVNLCSAAVYAVSVYVALNAFGGDWAFPKAAIVAAAGVIGAASSITPSGLGVREATAAGLSSLIGTDPAVAFAATAIVHMAMMAVTGVLAFYYFIRSKSSPVTA